VREEQMFGISVSRSEPARDLLCWHSTPLATRKVALCATPRLLLRAPASSKVCAAAFLSCIPPLFMSVGITVLAYRKRNQFSQADSPDSSRDDW